MTRVAAALGWGDDASVGSDTPNALAEGLFWMADSGEVDMPEERRSAYAAMRALRDELRARLDENEDYRAWKALDEALRELEPRSMPKAVDLALDAIATTAGLAEPKLPRADDPPLDFARRDRS